ncbi:MAG: serine/threonine-protein kinase [Archangium sp.]
MTKDRDLLEALFVQQLGFAPASEVISAGAQWLVQRERGASLTDVLQERGMLDARQVKLVRALVDEAVAAHGGDAAVTLDNLPESTRDSLQGLSATLRPEHTPPRADVTVSFDSLETPENIGSEAKGRYSFDTGPRGRVEELGRGGAGRVVVARDHFLGRDVALKELHRDITQNPKFDTLHVRNLEARFLREARVTGQLDHPAIVPVYELGRRRDGTLYYTMRRVRGRTLAQAFSDSGGLEGRLALLPDLLTACRAVAAAHHRDVVHRDLKPQNVMLGPHGETFVMEWGLARVMGKADRTRKTPMQLAPDLTGGRDLGPVGTPSYMSPEQAQGDRDALDARSDVWGLGAMLFELLTGRAPYVGRSPWEVLAEVRSSPPPKVKSLEPAAPPELVAVCERALSWHREHRYVHAGELAAELEAWLSGARVKAYDYSATEVLRRTYRRYRALALLGAVTFISVLVVAIVSAVGVRRERDEARAMSRFFLADVAPALANVPGAAEVWGQLSSSALEVFSAGVDPERGSMADRLLLARTWNDVAHQAWRGGDRLRSHAALEQATRMLAPLQRQRPDDIEVRATAIEHATWRADLLIDEGKEEAALVSLDALLAEAEKLEAAAPNDAAAMRVHALVLSRMAVVRFTRGDIALSLELSKRARDAAFAFRRAAPNDVRASSAVLDESTNLSLAQFASGKRDEALTTLRDASRQAQTMRSQRDSKELQAAHATVLVTLARALDPGVDAVERREVLRQGRRMLSELLAADPARNFELFDATQLALLDGDVTTAWQWAQRIEALGVGAEFEEAVLAAAFATGRDEVVRQKARETGPGSPGAVALYGALVESLAGNTQLARAHLAKCFELRCVEPLVWHAAMVLRRTEGREDAVALTLKKLATEHPLAVGDAAGIEAGLRELDAHLRGAP